MDEVAAEWNFVVGNAECDLVGETFMNFTVEETVGSAKLGVRD